MNERLRLRAGFNNIAELYDRVRPGYPDELFVDLADLTGIGVGSRVLEIGCGTGQASVGLVGLGCRLLAVELGDELARIARQRLATYPARVVVADFDRWTPDESGFDVVFAATAFHWLDPATRYRRTAELLARHGFLVVVNTTHIAGGTKEFFEDVQSCYRKFDPASATINGPEPAHEIPLIDHPGVAEYYQQPIHHRYEWNRDYTTAEYLDLLRSYSATFRWSRPTQEGLLRSIGWLIDGRYGGHVTKRYLTEMRVTMAR